MHDQVIDGLMSLLYTIGQLLLQIWVNTYVNPAELGGNQGRILCLSCCWKELVFLHVLKGKATRTTNICMATLTTKAYT